MIPLENERFRELARQVARGAASDAARKELDRMLSQDPALKEQFEQIRKETLLLRETLPLLDALDASPRAFPAYARERLQTKVRETLGRKIREGPTGFAEKLLARTKVLLVDDEKAFTSLLKANLEETGKYEVRVENWAEDAFAAAKECQAGPHPAGHHHAPHAGRQRGRADRGRPGFGGHAHRVLHRRGPQTPGHRERGIISDHPCIAKPASLEAVTAVIEKHARKRAD